jgi:hypothetical protein
VLTSDDGRAGAIFRSTEPVQWASLTTSTIAAQALTIERDLKGSAAE